MGLAMKVYDATLALWGCKFDLFRDFGSRDRFIRSEDFNQSVANIKHPEGATVWG